MPVFVSKFKQPVFWLGILGAIKLASEAFGITIITDDQVNAIANGFASLFAVIGVVIDSGIKKQ